MSSNNNKFAVEVNDLVKTYRTGSVSFRALDGLSLKVRKGEIVSIVGPSGSGKSTLLNMIGLLDKPSSGTVLIDGVNVSKLDEDSKAVLRNKKIGFVFQAYNLIHRLTAIENVELPLIALGIRREVRRQRAKETNGLRRSIQEILQPPIRVERRRTAESRIEQSSGR